MRYWEAHLKLILGRARSGPTESRGTQFPAHTPTRPPTRPPTHSPEELPLACGRVPCLQHMTEEFLTCPVNMESVLTLEARLLPIWNVVHKLCLWQIFPITNMSVPHTKVVAIVIMVTEVCMSLCTCAQAFVHAYTQITQ